jgi:hypothetical protein
MVRQVGMVLLFFTVWALVLLLVVLLSSPSID